MYSTVLVLLLVRFCEKGEEREEGEGDDLKDFPERIARDLERRSIVWWRKNPKVLRDRRLLESEILDKSEGIVGAPVKEYSLEIEKWSWGGQEMWESNRRQEVSQRDDSNSHDSCHSLNPGIVLHLHFIRAKLRQQKKGGGTCHWKDKGWISN